MENNKYNEDKKVLNNNPTVSYINQIQDVYGTKKKKNMNAVYGIFLAVCVIIAIFFFVTNNSVMSLILGIFFSILAFIMIVILIYTNAPKPYIMDDEEELTDKDDKEEK